MPDHLETIIYEIDMLDYCFDRLRRPWLERGKEYNLCLEGFLLHYRNLIEFFASHVGDPKAGAPKGWSPRRLSPVEFDSIQNKAIKKHYGPISSYLSHCDRIRKEEGKYWRYVEMYEEIKPFLESLRKLFPSVPRPPVATLGPEGASTASGSSPTPSMLDSERTALGLKPIGDKARQKQNDSTEK
jgi:hypothetical protein